MHDLKWFSLVSWVQGYSTGHKKQKLRQVEKFLGYFLQKNIRLN